MMRRSGPLKRRTELRAKTPLVGSTPLQRASRLTRSAISRRIPKVAVEERNARRLLAERSNGRCECCASRPATDYAHRVARSQGGPWCPSNAVHACRDCHSWSHANPAKAYALGWMLRRHQDPATTPVYLLAHGLVYLRPDGGVTRVERKAA